MPVAPLKVPSSDIGGNLGVVLSRDDGVREFHPPYGEAEQRSIASALEHLPVLESGQSWIIVVELLSYFSKQRALISRPDNRIKIREGTYSLQAFYRWDFRPGFVLRSDTMRIRIARPTVREKSKLRKAERALGRRFDRSNTGDSTYLCREAYTRGGRAPAVIDFIRATLEEGLEQNPLGTVGALYLIEENQEGPCFFLYDLITYKESHSEEDLNDDRRFLRELVARWPDGFVGEVARQRRRFEEIAVGMEPGAVRPPEKEIADG